MFKNILEVCNLSKNFGGLRALDDCSLSIKANSITGIIGPNGSGKSTLSSVIAGNENYEVISGSISFEGEDLLDLDPDQRAHKGVFLSFQYPVEIPGISVSNFIKAAITEKRKVLGLEAMSAKDLLLKMKEKMDLLDMQKGYLSRNMNEGFSGGEKKRNEIFQMAMLEPKLAILDETDSGLDIDALRVVANGVNKLKNSENATIVITHYQRLLDHIIPDYVHVLHNGRIVKSGGKELAHELEEKGYDWITKEADKKWG